MDRKGTANLPLHYGRPPEYLYKRMVKLGGTITDLIVQKFGVQKLMESLSDPFWFHSLSLATGFDWNSSGTTTATLSALKEYYSSGEGEIFILGGKGKNMGGIREEISSLTSSGALSEKDGYSLRDSSKKVAKIDQDLLHDTFDLYMHFLVADRKGNWVVVQQGMNQDIRMARRYHWISRSALDYLNDGRNGISAEARVDRALNLSTSGSMANRNLMLELSREKPENYRYDVMQGEQRTLDSFTPGNRALNLDVRVNWKLMRSLYEYQPENFENLLYFKGAGKSAMRAISYMAELIYGEPPSYKDPVKYSFALGGKDGIPKPVNVRDYDLVSTFYSEVLRDSGNAMYDRVLRNLSRYSFSRTSGHDAR